MTYTYSQRSLIVLAFLGTLSAIMSLLSVSLIFRLQSHHAGIKDSPNPSAVPPEVLEVLMPVSSVLSALSLTLNLSSLSVCLLHSYFTTEICRREDDTDRADWFLLDSRAVRHVAIGLFCIGVSVYLAAMSIYMLLTFEMETGIAGACVLASGVLVLLVTVAHSMVRAARAGRRYRNELPDTMYQNEQDDCPSIHPSALGLGEKPRRHRSHPNFQRQFSYPPCVEPQRQPQRYSSPNVGQSHLGDKEAYIGGGSVPRMHRTLSAESGLLQGQSKPWNGINSEMRTVLARKAGGTSKDSTLV